MHVCTNINATRDDQEDNKLHWYVDSGASNHMINTDVFMYNKRSVENKKVVVADQNELPVSCAGDVDLTILCSKNKKVTVKDVEYVPTLCANLLSVKQMANDGKKIVFKGETCKIFDNDNSLITCATVNNNLYRINIEAHIKNKKSLYGQKRC